MSYIVCISKDAYKQNNTYYLRKGNTMKNSLFAILGFIAFAGGAIAFDNPNGTNVLTGWEQLNQQDFVSQYGPNGTSYSYTFGNEFGPQIVEQDIKEYVDAWAELKSIY
jgi:hypothetical protein